MSKKIAYVLTLVIIIAVFCLLASHLNRVSNPVEMADEKSDSGRSDEIESAVRQLWSADKKESQEAVRRLSQMGEEAIPPVLSLLEDLTRNNEPKFATGKEKEGAAAWKYYQDLPMSKRGTKDLEFAYKFVINGRLQYDCYEILGNLRAKEAVALILSIIEDREMEGMEMMAPDMRALAKIGSPAVPALIELIQTAQAKAYQRLEGVSYLDEQSRSRRIRQETRKFQIRAVLVLGEIRDKTALPVLESLLNTDNDRVFLDEVKEAIRKIKSTQTF